MDETRLNDYIKRMGISRDQILREEAEMEILAELANDKLGSKLVFYGGTALRLAYNSPRFSEDIDLLRLKPVSFAEFKKFIEKVIAARGHWQLKDIKNKRQTMFALIQIKDNKLKHAFSVKIEAHKPAGKVKLKTDLLLLKSPLAAAEPLLLVPTLAELKKLKINALLGRKKSRDIFDLWYLAQVLREKFELPKKLSAYSEREFRNELQVFLPKKYYPVIKELYGKINGKNK
jgi:predicted nucleotidyltransferase component of viral defense system